MCAKKAMCETRKLYRKKINAIRSHVIFRHFRHRGTSAFSQTLHTVAFGSCYSWVRLGYLPYLPIPRLSKAVVRIKFQSLVLFSYNSRPCFQTKVFFSLVFPTVLMKKEVNCSLLHLMDLNLAKWL